MYTTNPPTDTSAAPALCIVGAGAAGLMAAVTAAEIRNESGNASAYGIVLIEHGNKPARKLRITGKGRCNLTNLCGRDELLSNIPTNPRFLYAALSNMMPEDTVSLFEGLGVPLKVERGHRVFPVSDKANDVAEALVGRARRLGVTFVHGHVDALLSRDGHITGVTVGAQTVPCSAVILCTGGLSYPLTGSDGSGYGLARSVGHSVQTPTASLVPIVCAEPICRALMGLSLKNVRLTVKNTQTGKSVFEEMGEMLFTHFGVTGPLVLSASSVMTDVRPGKYKLLIDFKPALNDAELDARLVSDFSKYANRDFINALDDLLPQKAIQPLVAASGIPERKKVNAITRDERRQFVRLLHGLELTCTGFRPISEAIVTKGGVTVSEVNPKTMESRLCDGLYFAGEILDVDGFTGGFNLQIAFSTGRLAAQSALRRPDFQ